MKTTLKLLVSSTLIALIFSGVQRVHGMERDQKYSEDTLPQNVHPQDNVSIQNPQKHIQKLEEQEANAILKEQIVQNSLSTPSENGRGASQDYTVRTQNAHKKTKVGIVCFMDIPDVILCNIFNLNGKSAVTFRVICKYFLKLLKAEKIEYLTATAKGYEQIYERFLRGALIYRPDPESDVGMVTLPIAALANPLEGTFDLSPCGDTGQKLSIATGYRTGVNPASAEKVEIWLAPRFLVEQNLNGSAKHFQSIFGQWDARNPLGIFWTWGGNNDLTWYDYLIRQSIGELSNKENLYEKWYVDWRDRSARCLLHGSVIRKFQFYFELK